QLTSSVLSLTRQPPPRSTLFPYTTLFRSLNRLQQAEWCEKRQKGCHARHIAGCLAEPEVPRCRSTAEKLLAGCSGSARHPAIWRSEEHTSELQSPYDLVCRLLLEKKKHTQFVDAFYRIAQDRANKIVILT